MCAFCLTAAACAQPPRPRLGANIRSLESKAQEAQREYLQQLATLAKTYEDSGNVEQAQEALRQMLKVDPENDQVREKMKELEEKVFEENNRVFEVDSSKGWISTVKVKKGEPIRLMAEGTYKMIVNSDIGPEGFSTADVMRDMGAGINCGALMGAVLEEPSQRNRTPQMGKPFPVGKEAEVKPEADGVLFLKLNVPPGSKNIGKVKVMVAGNISALGS
jgi:hypothetical protein